MYVCRVLQNLTCLHFIFTDININMVVSTRVEVLFLSVVLSIALQNPFPVLEKLAVWCSPRQGCPRITNTVPDVFKTEIKVNTIPG